MSQLYERFGRVKLDFTALADRLDVHEPLGYYPVSERQFDSVVVPLLGVVKEDLVIALLVIRDNFPELRFHEHEQHHQFGRHDRFDELLEDLHVKVVHRVDAEDAGHLVHESLEVVGIHLQQVVELLERQREQRESDFLHLRVAVPQLVENAVDRDFPRQRVGFNEAKVASRDLQQLAEVLSFPRSDVHQVPVIVAEVLQLPSPYLVADLDQLDPGLILGPVLLGHLISL